MARKPLKPSKAARNERKQDQHRLAQSPKQEALCRLAQHLRLLPKGWMKATTTTEPIATREDPDYAGGWWTNLTPEGSLVAPDLPRDAYWASGHDGQKLYVVPSAKLVVVRLGFSPSADDIRTDALVADVLKALGK